VVGCSGEAEVGTGILGGVEPESRDRTETEPAQRYAIPARLAGARLDAALADLAGASRAQVQRWIAEGLVEVDGQPARASLRVTADTVAFATPRAPAASDLAPEDIPLAVLHEDAHLLVLDKPAGMVVHPGPGHHSGTLVNALLYHCRDRSGESDSGEPHDSDRETHWKGSLATRGGVERPGIVHRLDRGTSGVMVVAKNDVAHAALAAQFHDHTIDRIYHAFVRAVPEKSQGRVERPIGRHPRDRKRMSVRTNAGRKAITNWRVLERFRGCATSLLEVRPETGRTHQIRVHLASAGLPIVGDPVYGRADRSRRPRGDPPVERPALHAAALGFEHPESGQRMHFETPLPGDLAALLVRLRAPREAKPG
jgi:23S rRNA pseudouridine1911/1915/1917 synthase